MVNPLKKPKLINKTPRGWGYNDNRRRSKRYKSKNRSGQPKRTYTTQRRWDQNYNRKRSKKQKDKQGARRSKYDVATMMRQTAHKTNHMDNGTVSLYNFVKKLKKLKKYSQKRSVFKKIKVVKYYLDKKERLVYVNSMAIFDPGGTAQKKHKTRAQYQHRKMVRKKPQQKKKKRRKWKNAKQIC